MCEAPRARDLSGVLCLNCELLLDFSCYPAQWKFYYVSVLTWLLVGSKGGKWERSVLV